MKTTLFAVLLTFNVLSAWAQQVGWTMLNEKSVVEWDGVPPTAAEKLESMVKRNRVDMHHIAFPHSAQGWIMNYHSGTPGQGASYNKSWEEVPRDLVEQVQALCDKSIHVRQVVFFHSDKWENMGWLILHGDNECSWKFVPEGLAAVIRQLHTNKRRIVDIATDRNGGWVLIADNNEFFSENIPADLKERLETLKKEGAQLQQVAIHAADGWLVLYNGNEAAWKNLPESLVRRINELRQAKINIESVSFWSLPVLSID